MTEPRIQLTQLNKSFRVYERPSDLLWEFGTGRKRHRNFPALTDINLTVGNGETVGVIGRNGAGKSTLLRIVAGTLAPSSGALCVNGRVSAILELGTGFNPEYTGRANIHFGGLCLGLSREKINELEQEIIQFSELEDFIDQPFRTYSTGMQARLTFSVAVSVDPEILIVDEALSVGDAKFQLKSFDRMNRFRQSGKTILVVSHDINTVATLCTRAILLDKGRLIEDGDPNRVGKIYHELLFGPQAPATEPTSDQPQCTLPRDEAKEAATSTRAGHRYGDFRVRINQVQIRDQNGRPTTQIDVAGSYCFRIAVTAHETIDDYVIGLLIRTSKGIEVLGTDSSLHGSTGFPMTLEKDKSYAFDIEFVNYLAPGVYFLTASLAQQDETKIDMWFDCLAFNVTGPRTLYTNSLVSMPITFSSALPEYVNSLTNDDGNTIP
jgi:lipopolysaccharide transport system ATP-binding protein